MANYTVADIQALRERTGAGMMDVKKALDEADGNLDQAIDILRVKGLKGVSKREGRAASEGLVAAQVTDGPNGQVGFLIELNSETDFVAKNDKFLALASDVLAAVVSANAADTDQALAAPLGEGTVADAVTELAGTLGEKIELRRIARVEAEVVVEYLHRTNRDLPAQVGVLVGANAAAGEVARDIAMHIAAFSPTYLQRDDIPGDVLDRERTVATETARNEGKPDAALPKIVEGRMNGFFKEAVLVEQAYAKDNKTTVGKVLSEVNGEVTAFVRFRVGA